MIPVYVISLTSSTARRDSIHTQLSGLGIGFTFVDAVDGRTAGPEMLAGLDPQPYAGQFNRPLSAGEIGCAASHFAVLAQIAAGDAPFALVLEDDAVLTPGIETFLRPETLAPLMPFDSLRLYNDIPKRTRGLAAPYGHVGRAEIVAPLIPGLGSIAQVFSRAGAANVLRHALPLRAPIDSYFSDGLLGGYRTIEARPAPVITGAHADTSEIGVSRYDALPARRQFAPLAHARHRVSRWTRRARLFVVFAKAWGLPALLRLRYRTA